MRNPFKLTFHGKTAAALGVSFNTIAKAVDHMVRLGLLVKSNTYNRNRIFTYANYLDLLRKGS